MTKKEFVQRYIDEINDYRNYDWDEESAINYEQGLFRIIQTVTGVMKQEIPTIDEDLWYKTGSADEDADILIGKLELFLINDNSNSTNESVKDGPMIFLSHCSKDKKYGDALRNFIVGLGVKNDQLIYSSHPLHKIPLDAPIYEYLRKNIHKKVFMIILWSNDYLESPACLNEMGAAWVVQTDYTNLYVPSFSFGNPKYHQCAVDTTKMGAVLNGDNHCKQSLIELKNKIIDVFDIEENESQTLYLIDEFVKAINEIESNNIKIIQRPF